MGDEAGLWGHGTSGEGCDAAELKLPGVQQELLHALADTGLPVVAVLVTGRPYALGGVAGRLAAIVQAFFPGEEGGPAIAGVVTGRVTFRLHADRTSFTGQDLTRIVEPGTITMAPGGSSDDLPLTGSFALTGPVRTVGIDRVLGTPASVKKLTD